MNTAATCLEKAIDFIYSNGTRIETARLDSILKRNPPHVLEAIGALQNDDGGFPYNMEPGKASTLNTTEFVLVWLHDLALLDSEAGRKAFRFILSMQSPDGTWDEKDEIMSYGPPPWALPHSEYAIAFTTANSAFWLGVGGLKEEPFMRACTFLKSSQDESGRFPGFLHTTWIGASVLAMEKDWKVNPVRRALSCLDERAPRQWEASQISWMLWCFSLAGIPSSIPFVRRAFTELLTRQEKDGRFASEDGDSFSVNSTLEAVKVIIAHTSR
ncbi:MAG: terpene cyclase/mutase family protein [Theionarchaea archaeon]|nr:terpene cyclase/mutase family protein [Theionarchaea archaeon]MBU7001984.1 terpene cyclase/mutase family protein [Theionarchaea archaeon]MBU7019765.1 terpene cyclase/mutase family protein [Theionarchaea archaeon]MBU7034615.1 terpene cyclase/mutase family protein [Theionarchaea archaeon]MBU7040628.1 terpene cyclase/mutase family protein [Theionarchaea archaeon]